MDPAVGDRDPDYLLAIKGSSEAIPSTHYATFIRRDEVQQAIGAKLLTSDPSFDQCDDPTHAAFSKSGETGRTFLPQLAELADAGFRILIWVSCFTNSFSLLRLECRVVMQTSSKYRVFIVEDAPISIYRANWLGLHQSMAEMSWYGNQTFNNTELTNMTINGDAVASFAVVDNFTFAYVLYTIQRPTYS